MSFKVTNNTENKLTMYSHSAWIECKKIAFSDPYNVKVMQVIYHMVRGTILASRSLVAKLLTVENDRLDNG